MTLKNIAHLFLVAAAVIMFAPSEARALSFNISMSPENPVPNQAVFMSVSALEFNMDLSNISWTVDGKPKESGVGKKAISVTAPANGKTLTVVVKVIPNIGGLLEQSVTISPSELDLIWEATDSYVPPFYRGKALPVSQSIVKVAAIPNVRTSTGALKPASSFVYSWKKDGNNVLASSGYGKSSMSFANQILDKQNRVEVSVTDGTKTVSSSVTIVPFTPEILLYEEYSLTGIQYQEALGLIKEMTAKPRTTIVAEPYFLSKNFKTNPDIKTIWKLNNQEVKATKKNILTINTSNTKGDVIVNFAYDDIRRIFRESETTFNLRIR